MKDKKFNFLKSNLLIYNMYNSIGDFVILTNFIEKYNLVTENQGSFFGSKFGTFYDFNFLYAKRFSFIKLFVFKRIQDVLYLLFFLLFSYFRKSYIVIFSHKNKAFKLKIFNTFLLYITRIEVIEYSLYGSQLFINEKLIEESKNGLFYNDMFDLILKELNFTKEKISLPPFDVDLSILNKYNLGIQKYFVLNLGSAQTFKDRTTEDWMRDIEFCLKNYKDFKIVFLGDNKQKYICDEIINYLSKDYSKDIFLNLIEKVNTDELLTIISKARLFIGLQSGLSHIAYRQNVPSILFSISVEKYYDISSKNVTNLRNLKNCKCSEHNFEYCVSKDYYACVKEIDHKDFQSAVNYLMGHTK